MMGILDLSGQRLMFGVVAMLVLLATHGFFVALFARLLGDPGPAQDGRLTLNPLAHADVVGVIALILTPFGWIKPVTLSRTGLRGGVFGAVAVVVLSVLATLALAYGLWQLRPLVYALLPGNIVGITLIGVIEYTARVSIGFALFNLVPIPPLTAGNIWSTVVPERYASLIRHIWVLGLVLAAAIVFGLPQLLLNPAIEPIQDALFR